MDNVFINTTILDGFEKEIINYKKDVKSLLPISAFNFNRINIFVGSNNSGKSRLLRHIFSNFKEDTYFKIETGLSDWISKIHRLSDMFYKLYGTRDYLNNLINYLDNHFIFPSNEIVNNDYEPDCSEVYK